MQGNKIVGGIFNGSNFKYLHNMHCTYIQLSNSIFEFSFKFYSIESFKKSSFIWTFSRNFPNSIVVRYITKQKVKRNHFGVIN